MMLLLITIDVSVGVVVVVRGKRPERSMLLIPTPK